MIDYDNDVLMFKKFYNIDKTWFVVIRFHADHSFIRFHGRNTTQGHYWYNYLYTKEELRPWVGKIEQVKKDTKVLRVYFNNHYGGKAIVNALQFKEMTSGTPLSDNERKALEHAQAYLAKEQIKGS